MTLPNVPAQFIRPDRRLVMKQVVARIDGRTTMICLDAHGKVAHMTELFDLLNGQWELPPFHYGCRSLVIFIKRGVEPADRTAAEKELERRLQELGPERFAREIERATRTQRPTVFRLFAPDVIEGAVSAQALEAATARVALAKKAKKYLTDTISAAAHEHGGRMYGLKWSVKKPDSLARKVDVEIKLALRQGRTLSIADALEDMTDVNRYTVVWNRRVYAEQQAALRNRLQSKGWTLMKDKNSWRKGGPYRGHNTVWQTPDGTPVEIQFHTRQSWWLKEKVQHRLYEEARIIPEGTQRWMELQAQMIANAQGVTVPGGALRLGTLTDPTSVAVREAKKRYRQWYEKWVTNREW